jgi:hypothetical protein
VQDTTTLDLPSNNYRVLIIQKHISTLYTYYHICIPKHFSFNTYHIPQHNLIYNIIPCYSNHPSNIILSSQILNPIILNSITHNIYIYIYIYIKYHVIHSHVVSCMSLYYLIFINNTNLAFFNLNSSTYIIFTTQISCILQYQFINIFYFHNIIHNYLYKIIIIELTLN